MGAPKWKSSNNGTGLGLWVSSEIVKKHCGSLKVRSCTEMPRRGTVFSVFIPNGMLPSSVALRNPGA